MKFNNINTRVIFRHPVILPVFKFIFFICFFILNTIASIAQNNRPVAMSYFPTRLSKATIHLTDGSKINVKIIDVKDSSLMVFENNTAIEDNVFAKGISISKIHSIRVKRNSVVKGLSYGTVIGGILGYVVANATYNDNPSDYEDSSKQALRSWEGAVIGAVPGAVAGGIIGGIFTKRHFKINGDIERLRKMFKMLQKAED